MSRRLRFQLMVLVLAFAAWVTTVAAPAMAEPVSELLVSSDGTHWSADLGTPLFDPAVLWVPGDSRTSSFFVQNRGATSASVSLQVRTQDDANLVSTGAVQLQARASDDRWTSIVGSTGTAVLNALAIPIDGSRRIDVRAVFRAGSRNLTQTSAAVLRFVVQLGQAMTAAPHADSLPATGAPALRLPLLAAAACLGVGAALLRRRRRA
jgi:hypothetical protein